MDSSDLTPLPQLHGVKGRNVDKQFFAPGQGGSKVVQPFHYKYSEQGKQLTGRKLKTVTAMERDIDPADLKMSKKHFKGKRVKQRVRGVAAGPGGGGLGGGDYD
jgi:large subunit GTPase 1